MLPMFVPAATLATIKTHVFNEHTALGRLAANDGELDGLDHLHTAVREARGLAWIYKTTSPRLGPQWAEEMTAVLEALQDLLPEDFPETDSGKSVAAADENKPTEQTAAEVSLLDADPAVAGVEQVESALRFFMEMQGRAVTADDDLKLNIIEMNLSMAQLAVTNLRERAGLPTD